jgi:hypothetical protein
MCGEVLEETIKLTSNKPAAFAYGLALEQTST